MNNKLPEFKQLIFPSFLSLAKGVKISNAGIHSQLSYKGILINPKDVSQFAGFIGIGNPTPFVYIYILAQRAQAALMLQKEFTIAIPGLVHIYNRLEEVNPIDYTAPFDILVTVDVEYKEEGSLIPVFSVEFTQNAIVVVKCQSTYLAKRKSKKPKSTTTVDNPATKPFLSQEIVIPANAGRQYAKIAGDRNPIHTSTLLAKLFGFKRPIAHGWYLVSKIVNLCEQHQNTTYKTINVEFKSPVFLPGAIVLQVEEKPDGILLFSALSKETGKLVLTGSLRA
jgi:acyl dehydratase